MKSEISENVTSGIRDNMKSGIKAKWQELCARAAVEYDHDKLLSLVAEIDRMLRESESSKDAFGLEWLRQ